MMGTSVQARESSGEHPTRIPVECPICHWRHFLEIGMDGTMLNTPAAAEIRAQLAAWLASRCPEHLGPIMKMSKN
jgi:hypothetical protein